ncbi:MAG: ATP-binding cassette domain-containing protein, partial [Acetobacteraceae bacterium]
MTARSPHDMTARSPHDMTARSSHDMTARSSHDMTARSSHDMTAHPPQDSSPLLAIEGLEIDFGAMAAVRGASLTVRRGETHCLVGESGCGKSVTALSVMGLLAPTATRRAAAMRFDGQDLMALSERQLSRLRGDRIGMIFQEPMTSLNPAYTVGSQMAEVYQRHRGGSRRAALDRAESLLEKVRITSP